MAREWRGLREGSKGSCIYVRPVDRLTPARKAETIDESDC
jgi:hypothetical protein